MKKLLFLTFGLIACAWLALGFCDINPHISEKPAADLSLSSVEDTALSENFSKPEYFGRTALGTLPNSEALLFAYDGIAAGIEECAEKINVYDGIHPISKEELVCAYDAYRHDRTEHFWLGNAYTISTTGESVVSITPAYIMSGSQLASARLEFDRAAEELLSLVSPDMSEFERELVLHDALAERIVYDTGAANAHDAYGALVEGAAVCEGYAEALAYLLSRAGIQSFIVTGSSINPSTEAPEEHAWNMVRIDGEYYHTDLTWNDQGSKIFHAYFNVSDTLIKEDHVIDATMYGLPSCTSSLAMYFSVKEGAISEYTPELIADLLKKNTLSAHVYISGSVQDFLTWYYANIRDIAAAAGITGGFSYGCSRLGRELALTVTPSVAVSKISLKIDTGMALRYYVHISDTEILNIGMLAVRFYFDGMTDTVTEYELVGGEYVFSFDGILFHQMCEEIDAELLLIGNGTEVSGGDIEKYGILGEKKGVSVEKYCLKLLEIYEGDAAIVNLAASLLQVGAEAQKYMNYNTEKLPADGVSLPSTDFVPTEADALRFFGNTEELYIKDVFLMYDGDFKLCIEVCYNTDGYLSASVPCEIFATEEQTLGTRRYILASECVLGFDNFKRTEFSTENASCELWFSLNSCIYEIISDGVGDASEEFATALYRLGKAADTYALFGIKQP